MVMAVGWSELPHELLNLISKCFDVEIDLIRFRSTCSTWRSSSIPNPKYPFQLINNTTPFFYLSKQSFFLIKPPPPQEEQTLLRPWLIRITQNSLGKTQLLMPLFRYSIRFPFTHVLDFTKFSVLHLETKFIWDYQDSKHNYNCHYIYHNKFYFHKGDICLFKGRPYATDKFGKTIMVGLDNDVQFILAEPLVDGGDIKFLVKSEGDLLLVDVYECIRVGFPGHDPVRIDVFKLNEKEKKWVKLTSLGDRVLFLGFKCSFSTSASDLCVSKGNSVIFMDHIFTSGRYAGPNTCVLHLDQGRLSSLSDSPEYSNLFWPPPDWIVKS